MLGCGTPTLGAAWAWYAPQALRAAPVALVAARPLGPTEAGRRETVTVGRRRYELDRGDVLRLAPGAIRRVRWLRRDGRSWVLVRLAPALEGALARRSARLLERAPDRYPASLAFSSDVLMIDGAPVAAAHHTVRLTEGRFAVVTPPGEDDASVRELYRQLTGTTAP
jgi:hypothetical protein